MIEALTTVASFLLAHADLVDDIAKAIEGGMSKDAIRKAIRDAMVAASDAAMHKELG
jgi:hypothetical protein